MDMSGRVRDALAGLEPYDPAFTPCKINLSANENTHQMPDAFMGGIRAAMLATPLNRYPDPMANELRAVIAARHGVDTRSICVGNGGDELLFNLIFAFGGPGRALVTCPPDFSEYQIFARMCETPCVEAWRDLGDFSVDGDALVDAARSAAMVFVASPNNPTGNVFPQPLVRRLLDETDALVLVDEAYVDFAPQGASVVGWVAGNPRLMVLRTLSKAFGMAGVRCGYLVADPAVVDVLGAIRQIYSEDVVAQAAALAAIRNRDLLAPVVEDIVGERERLLTALQAIPGTMVWPSETNFLLVRVPGASAVRARLRDEHSILVRDFSYARGLEGCLRVTVGTRQENDALVEALRQILEEER